VAKGKRPVAKFKNKPIKNNQQAQRQNRKENKYKHNLGEF
jgi:hypothetical protein